MTWRLRLICGHVTQRTAYASYPTIERAFNGSVHECPECGLSPAGIVAGKPLINAGRGLSRLHHLQIEASALHRVNRTIRPDSMTE